MIFRTTWQRYLFILLIPFAFCHADCNYELLFDDVAGEKLVQLNAALRDVGLDVRKAADFIRKFGTAKRFSFPDSIDGRGPVAVKHPVTDENIGERNSGIFYLEADGESRVIKLINAPEPEVMTKFSSGDPSIEKDVESRTRVLSFVRTLEGSAMGETQGAPKLKNFGKFSYKFKEYFYLEMEALFPGKPRITLKEAVRQSTPEFNPFTKTNKFTAEPVTRQIAKQVLKAVINNYNPGDADFMVSGDGEVRWIDTTNWTHSDWRNPNQQAFNQGAAGRSIRDLLEMIAKRYPESSKTILDELHKELATSKELNDLERSRLTREIFGSN